MEKIRRRSSCSCRCGGNDDLALVKAAAWAWFQHGTGSEETMQEFNVRRTLHDQDPKPSRYKLEAMELANQGTNDSDERLKSPTRARADSLLDRFEIESISRRLDQLIKSSGDRDREGGHDDKRILVGSLSKLSDDADLRCRSKTSPPPPQLQSLKPLLGYLGPQESKTLLASENYTIRGKKKKMSKNNFRGFWPMHVVMCGTHEDVVLGTTRSLVDKPRRQRQRPEKGKVYSRVPVVELPNCRPRSIAGRQTRVVIN